MTGQHPDPYAAQRNLDVAGLNVSDLEGGGNIEAATSRRQRQFSPPRAPCLSR